ncbi:predicted protein [Aspergillus terreus NIH2624]|uniref:FAD dependent oxidoreductase domain-containing protein n=1 Tax=Aspergillus terreus (strain NIH 2624 / FGSC A1156) TaxID=341663 RepID=Q0C9X1_ASPTN|nr:uncharacterized protein ATEG_09513 [Aspergillus terreus NIH2624]EAU29704.1 predicted protein [Aspergillus terreus NIH2624]
MEVVIIGSGVIGLLSAQYLAQAGHRVTVIARDLPGDETQDWASPWAGAGIFPQPDTNGRDLQEETFIEFWALAHRDPTSGVQVVKTTEFYDDRTDDSSIWYQKLVPKYRRIPSQDLPEGAKIGFQYLSMTVNPARYLPWLKKKLDADGVRFIRKEVHSFDEAVQESGAKTVVNASGLGAFELSNDKDVVAVRGQTMLAQTDFDELMMWQGSQYTYVIPRMYTGCVIIGGVSQEGNLDRAVDENLRSDILARVKRLTAGGLDAVELKAHVKKDIVAFRPARKGGYRLETEGNVVHAYGFGGLGYTFSHGAARRVRDLVSSLAHKGGRESRL